MSAPAGHATVVVAGLGSEFRRDDGVGSVVAERAVTEAASARDVGPIGDPLDLLGVWNNADLVVIVDAVASGAPPGQVRVLEMDVARLSAHDDGAAVPAPQSTHGIGLAGVLRLARALGQAPARLVVVGIEGERFDLGRGLSPSVQAAVPEAVRRVVELIKEVHPCA